MKPPRLAPLALCLAVICSLVGLSTSPGVPGASAAATTTTIFSTVLGGVYGEGGQFDQPLWDAYQSTKPPLTFAGDSVGFISSPDMDQARENLVTGQADFAIAEGPLTGAICPLSTITTSTMQASTVTTAPSCSVSNALGVYPNEAGTAEENGLTVAYVPIAMEAVAVPFLVIPPTGCAPTEGVNDPFDCTLLPAIKMSPTTLEQAFEGSIANWSAPDIEADNGGQGFSSLLGSSAAAGPFPADQIDADASNYALTSYFIGTSAQQAWDLFAREYGPPPDTPVYAWPKRAPTNNLNQFQEADMIADLVPQAAGGLVRPMSSWASIYNMTAIPWSWTFPAYTGTCPGGPSNVSTSSAPTTTTTTTVPTTLTSVASTTTTTVPTTPCYPYALPDVSIENAAGAFVVPSLSSMEAAYSDASFATSPNILTFTPSSTDQTAYPAQMMTADYLEVPLNGLPPDKASALAGLIQYLLTASTQSAICSVGYLPVVQSGLNSSECPLASVPSAAVALSTSIQAADSQVISALNAEAVADTPTTTTTTTSTTTTSTTTTSTTTSSTTTTSTTTTSTTTVPTTTTTAPAATTTVPTTTTTAPAATTTVPTTTTTGATPTSAPTNGPGGPSTGTGPPAPTTLPPGSTGAPPSTGPATTSRGTATTVLAAGVPTSVTTIPPPPKTRGLSFPVASTTTTGTTLPPTATASTATASSPTTASAMAPTTAPAPVTPTTVGPGASGTSGLAFTGTDAARVAAPGFVLLAVGEASRSALRRRRHLRVVRRG